MQVGYCAVSGNRRSITVAQFSKLIGCVSLSGIAENAKQTRGLLETFMREHAAVWSSHTSAMAGVAAGDTSGAAGGNSTFTPVSARRAAIASSSLRRCPQMRDAKLLQVLRRQVRKNRLVYRILAEYRLILPEAQAPQPDHNVHDKRPIAVIMIPSLRDV